MLIIIFKFVFSTDITNKTVVITSTLNTNIGNYLTQVNILESFFPLNSNILKDFFKITFNTISMNL